MRVTLITGFGLTAASWNPVVEKLPLRWDIAVVVPSSGRSFTEAAYAVGERGNGVYVGYSMGGRLALSLAVQRPDVVTALVPISATAGIRSETDRATRVELDAARAERVRTIGAAAFFDEWSRLGMFAGVESEAWGQRILEIDALCDQLTLLGQGRQPDLWSSLEAISAPALVVAGADDAAYVAAATEMVALMPEATLAVAAAGHAVPFEEPEWLAERIVEFVGAHADTR